MAPNSAPDPVFVEVAKALYGPAVDARELWDIAKASPDGADLNAGGNAAAPKKKHSKTGGLLLLGTAAESDAAFHATKQATRAVKDAGVIASKGSLGRAALQTANLGVGLVAAHQLLKKPKPPADTTVAKGIFRPAKVVMTEAQQARHTAALSRAATMGDRVVLGGALVSTAAVSHRMGRRKGAAQAGVQVSKGMLQPVNGVKAANSGGLSRGLGRHGRLIGGKTPAPHITPVAKPLPAAVVNNQVSKVAQDLVWSGEISKVDTDKRTVFGWCSLSKVDGKDVVDLQGDYVPLDEIEKSAYKYVIESRKGGDMHKRVSKTDEPLHTADLIESFVVTPDKLEQMGLAADSLPHGWWIGMKVNDDEQWANVKSGKRRAFSIHGTGSRKDMAAA